VNALIDKYFIKQPRIRRFVTRLLEGDKNSEIELLGAKLRINSIKEHGYLRASRMANRGSLFRDEASVLVNLAWVLSSADTFVDAGANVGLFSHIVARFRKLNPALRVYAFEANPDTFERLVFDCKELGIEAHRCALSDREGSLEFVKGAVSHVFRTVQNQSKYSITSERVILPCRRLDSFGLAGDSIVLKVDVEGHEMAVLRGAENFFREGRISAVYVDGYEDRALPDFLKERGFSLHDGRTLESIECHAFSLLALQSCRSLPLLPKTSV
jgi:FkbM family methyltransferase